MGTAAEQVRTMIRRQDAGDTQGYAGGFTPDGEFVHPAATVRGREALAAFIGGYHAAFPDGRHEVTRLLEAGDVVAGDVVAGDVVAGDVVAMEGTFTGTHTGPLPGPEGEIAPTGRTVTIRWSGFAHVVDGQVRSLHGYYDQLAFLGQLGLVPRPA
jgi:predicted ester cyclase